VPERGTFPAVGGTPLRSWATGADKSSMAKSTTMAGFVRMSGALVFATASAACSATTSTSNSSGQVPTTARPCHTKAYKSSGNLTGNPSTTVQLVGVLKGTGVGSTVPFEVVNAYGSCLDSFTVSGANVTFAVDTSVTPHQLTFLERQLVASGKFASVSQQHP